MHAWLAMQAMSKQPAMHSSRQPHCSCQYSFASTQTIEDAEVHQEDVDDTDIGLEYSKDDMAPPTTGPAAARVAYAAPMLVGVLRHIPFSSWHES